MLAITFRKLEGDFYDMSAMRISALGGNHVRTREWVLKAAEYLNQKLRLGIDSERLKDNTYDDSGLPVDLRATLIERHTRNPENTAPINEAAAKAYEREHGEWPSSVPFIVEQ